VICKQKGTCKTPAGNFLPGRWKWDVVLTSGFMELQCDMSIKSKAKVVIENIQRKLQMINKGREVKLNIAS
jgi:ADP-dependent phosphofructokinase/glucokinase